MAVSAQATGTQTTTVTTEHTLTDIAVAGTFTLHVDLVNMAAGDTVELRLYQIVLTGGTRRCVYYQSYTDAQGGDDTYPRIAISVPISNELTDSGSLRATLKQTTGTSRNFDWKVLKYA
jgi:hypothetical protein